MNTLQRHFVTTYTLAAYPSANNVYKLCTIVYKCLHAAAPSYLTEMCVPVAASTGRRCLRSAAPEPMQNENDNICITQFYGLRTTCLE